MSRYSWCLGPNCHIYRTQDRIRGTKGNKVLRTRRVRWYRDDYENKWNHFCSQNCMADYIDTHLQAFIRIAPRPEPLETRVEVTETHHPKEEYSWGTRRAYTTKDINILVDNRNE